MKPCVLPVVFSYASRTNSLGLILRSVAKRRVSKDEQRRLAARLEGRVGRVLRPVVGEFRRQTLAALAAPAVLPALTAVTENSSAQTNSPLSPDEARAIAKEVFFWGMHSVALYHLRYNTVQN